MTPIMRASDNLLSRWLVCSLLPWGCPVDSAGCDGVGVVVVADRVIQYSRTLGNPQSDLAIYYRVLGAVGHRYDR